MVPQYKMLESYDHSKSVARDLSENNSSLQAEGTINIVIQRRNGSKVMIKYVLYVPGMK